MIINARSPFIIEVNEALQTGSKVEIFIWNDPDSQPLTPNYTLSKAISASNNLLTTYNISPFIREYINLTTVPPTQGLPADLFGEQYCNVVVKRYSYDGASYTLLDTTTYLALDSYTEYSEGYNKDSGNFRGLEGTFYYEPTLKEAGNLTILTETDWKVKWTNLETLSENTRPLDNNKLVLIPKVRVFALADNYDEGNKLEILDDTDTVIFTATYKPKESCKYTPVKCDYVNKLGAFNRIWFYAKSTDKFKSENKDYNLLQSDLVNYDVAEGQKKVFNAQAKETIEVNTDWVSEDFKEIIKELMLSERILINDKPVTISSKDTELFKHINTNLINYKLEFEYAYNFIQNVM